MKSLSIYVSISLRKQSQSLREPTTVLDSLPWEFNVSLGYYPCLDACGSCENLCTMRSIEKARISVSMGLGVRIYRCSGHSTSDEGRAYGGRA